MPPPAPNESLPGFCLARVDEFAHALHAEIVAHHQDQRPGRDLGDRRERREIERIALVQRLRDQRAGRDEEQRMAVRRRAGELAQRRNEIAARLVLNEHGGAKVLAHLLRHQARHHVSSATRRQPDDDADRFSGLQLLRGGWLRGQCHKRECCACCEQSYASPSLHRHGRACPGHPRLCPRKEGRRGCPGRADKFTRSAQA